jgi:hypothetical protein
MQTRLIGKRDFLKAAGAAFVSGLLPRGAFALDKTDAVFAAALMTKDRSFGVALLSEAGEEIALVALPDRGHGLTFDPITARAVTFARRPGTFALVVDVRSARDVALIQAGEGRHFFGHGAFSSDGRILFIAENDFDNFRGVIGLYDAGSGFAKIGEFDAHGMDTHDLQVIEDGRFLVIANGGIKQHPDSGRAKLNLDHMEPSLVLLDARTGDLVEKRDMPAAIRQLSTRHVDTDLKGRIWFGCQFEGPRNEYPSLLGNFRRGEALSFLDMPEPVLEGFGNYIGAVSVNREAGLVAVSSPVGGQWAAFDVETGKLAYREQIDGVCGLTYEGDRFMRSTENGWFGESREPVAWDNHIIRVV